jgi:hypothetical protein
LICSFRRVKDASEFPKIYTNLEANISIRFNEFWTRDWYM